MKSFFLESENHWTTILVRQLKSPFVYLLFGAAALSFVLGQILDGSLILLFVGLNTLLGFYQEYRSEQTLKLLKQYLVTRARVRRNNQEVDIPIDQLVLGDVVLLQPGSMLSADIKLTQANNLTVDESVLTGESLPMDKSIGDQAFFGTTAVSGTGEGVVSALGKDTTYGDIVRLAEETDKESTYEKELRRFSRFTLLIVSLTLVGIILANLALKTEPSWFELAIFAIALAVGVIPEALPVVTTFSLSLGAIRLAKNMVVVKRLSAIEDLGSIEVLCTDKTGTLTENKLTVVGTYPDNNQEAILVASLAAMSADINLGNLAFDTALQQALTPTQQTKRAAFRLVEEIPFDPVRRLATAIIERSGKKETVSRGTPENILESCRELNRSEKEKILAAVAQQGREGIRALAVKRDDRFTGLIFFSDPVKASSAEAIRQAENLGVRVIILTGDSAEVAGRVAVKIGLIAQADQVCRGDQWVAATDDERHSLLETYSVFARVTPEQKHQIIQELEKNQSVGFLGEGINDAPALKIANVALAVAGASDVAREAADIVLLEKSLKVITEGILQGRKVFANTQKYILATLASNFGNFFAVAAASLIITHLPMLPLQILLLNLLTDFPMIAIATDTVESSTTRQPQRYNLGRFARMALLLGSVSTIFDFLFFGILSRFSPANLQTGWFLGSVLTELLFLYSIRSNRFFLRADRPSIWILIFTVLSGGLAIGLPYSGFGQRIFGFVSLPPAQLTLIFTLVLGYLLATETVKLLYLHQEKALSSQ